MKYIYRAYTILLNTRFFNLIINMKLIDDIITIWQNKQMSFFVKKKPMRDVITNRLKKTQ